MMNTYAKTAVRLTLIVGVVVLLAIVVLLKDSVGITFATGGLNLRIDSHATYNGVVQPGQTWALKNLVPGVDKFFNFTNVMPGDKGATTISFHTNENAWACMDFVNLADVDNGNNEPESPEDPDGPAGGELSKGMEFFGWVDDGDNTYEVGEQAIFGTSTSQSAFAALKKYILADSSTGSFFPTNVTKFVGIQWCAGNLVVNSSTGAVSCDGATLGNIAQSDGFSVDLGLRVVTADDYPGYRCDGSVPPPPTGPTVTLNLEKKFSGPVPLGYLPQQFTFRVVGSTTDQIVTLTPYTQDSANGSIQLPKGSYTITEIGPSGFVAGDWRPGWYGECKSGSTFATTIKIDDKNIDDGTLYCQVDNQYRPKNKNQTNSGSGNQASGVTPAQVSVTQTNKTSQAVTAQAQTPSVISRVVRTVREAIRR